MKFIKFKNLILFFLLLIIFLAVFLRFYKLGEIPNGLYVDEAATSYNAFSILATGKDEYGKTFPIAFRFFGSYSPPLYTYLTSLSIMSFGLNAFATRFVSAVVGVVGVIIVYFFFKDKKGLTAAFLVSSAPWAIFYSRAGYEINLGFIIFSLGTLFLWLGLKEEKYLIPAYAILSLSTYGAYSERYLAPLILLASIFVFRKFSLWGLLIAILLQIPNFYLLMTPAFLTKGGLFYHDLILTQAEKISILPKFLSYPLSFLREFLAKYLSYFSPRNLFWIEDYDPQRSLPGLSVFYFWMVVPYFVGIYRLWRQRKDLFSKYLFFLLLVFPIPLALTADPFSSQRGLPLLLPLILVITLGLDWLIFKYKKLAWFCLLVLSFTSLVFLWRSYFILLPFERAGVWGDGFKQLAEEIKKRPNENFVIDQSRTKPAYIELAFYLRLPPEKLQQTTDPAIKNNYYVNIKFSDYYRFANLETRNIDWEKDIYQEQILVGDELSISPQQAREHFLTKIFEIKDPLDRVIFQGFKTNPFLKCKVSYTDLYCKKYR